MQHARALAESWFLRGLLFSLIWLIIADAEPSSLLVGVPAIALATWASGQVTAVTTSKLSWLGLVRFAAYFLRESFRGGVDVARRTLRSRLQINPGFMEYRCRLSGDRPRVLFANCVSLLPGTLTAELQGDTLFLHVLDRNAPIDFELAALERHVAAIFVPSTGVWDD